MTGFLLLLLLFLLLVLLLGQKILFFWTKDFVKKRFHLHNENKHWLTYRANSMFQLKAFVQKGHISVF